LIGKWIGGMRCVLILTAAGKTWAQGYGLQEEQPPLRQLAERRDTIWKRAMGDDYLAVAYRWAHEAAPKAKLVVNDFNVIEGGGKADALYRVVKSLKEAGAPVHAVGFQVHWSSRCPSKEKIVKNLNRFAVLGLDVHVTEMDVTISPLSGTEHEKLAEQAKIYRTVLEACFEVETFKVFQMWGFTDRHTRVIMP